MNDYEIKVVKVQGEFTWHSHADTDELFLVIHGELTIQMRDGNVTLHPGQLFVVPRGVEHCPKVSGLLRVGSMFRTRLPRRRRPRTRHADRPRFED